ncbi:MAG TPA: DNA repair protein RecN [Clostridiales bacterium]|jgi:DNA repair protein RecN (Recombination protein N)|nr:DNA repair protein RecN [Clostridiales bacterium]
MITHLRIRNFAVIEDVSLDFDQGFHVFTGETGAGKSILIEALSLALGARADTAMIRTGCDRSTIELAVETDDEKIATLLQENELPESPTLILTREITAAGKSLARVNGSLVAIGFLNRLGRRLVDIHGQYDHQSLLDPDQHIHFLDGYAGEPAELLLNSVGYLYHKYQTISERLNRLRRSKTERLREADFLRFELAEIEAAAPKPAEDELLAEQAALLQNSQLVADRLAELSEMLFNSEAAALDGLGRSMKRSEELCHLSEPLASLNSSISDLYYQLDELKTDIRSIQDSIDYSPETLQAVLERIDVLSQLKRKHGGTLEAVLDHRDRISERLAEADEDEGLTKTLEQELDMISSQLADESEQLSRLRRKAAREMEHSVAAQFDELNFPHAHLTVAFKNSPPKTTAGSEQTGEQTKEKPALFRENGIDQVEFMIVTNPGETPKPLARIASGGEISRVMLALKTVIGQLDNIPTVIFDEIDSGISGQTASVVGRKLRNIAGNRQVLCITHLPQIAAGGDRHYLIHKVTSEDAARTAVYLLDKEAKIREVARLTSGLAVTEAALANARELIESFQ